MYGWAASPSFSLKVSAASESSYGKKPRVSELKRELGLRDLTLFAITCIVGTRWIAAAAHAGPGSVSLWLLTAALFAVPLAFAVASLTAKYPARAGCTSGPATISAHGTASWLSGSTGWVLRSGFRAPPCFI